MERHSKRFKPNKRLKEKYIAFMHNFSVATTTRQLNLFEPIHAGTLQGIHWKIHARQNSELSTYTRVNWCFMHLAEGESADLSSIGGTDQNADLLEKGTEKNCMGNGFLLTNWSNTHHGVDDTTVNWKEDALEGHIKTGRKFKKGDALFFVARGNAALGTTLEAQFTFWYQY